MEPVKTEIVLQDWVVARIRKSEAIKGAVAEELGISVRTLEDILPSNPKRLTQAGVLHVLRVQLGVIEDSELLTTRERAEAEL